MTPTKVIILNWNGTEHLSRYLPTVVANTPPEVEIVVADNGSTDGSVAWLNAHYPQVRVVKLDRNYGFAGGYNRALAELEGEYWVLLNSDVRTPEGWLDPLVEALDAEADVAAVGPKILADCDPDKFEYAGAAGGYLDVLGFPFCRGRILQTVERDEGQYDDARDVFWVSGAAFCCRASVFRALGGFDADFFAHMEEIDLCWRMQLQGWRVRIVPQSRVWHLGGGTLSNDSPYKLYLNYRNNLAMLLKCASTRQRFAVACLRPLTDGLAALLYLFRGKWAQSASIVKAYKAFFKEHPTLQRKRQELQRNKRQEARHIYRESIVVRYLLGKHTFNKEMRGL
jgi:hypothetical protein